MSATMGVFPRESRKKKQVRNSRGILKELSVFEPLKFYCIENSKTESSEDPDETALYEPPHWDLLCLKIQLHVFSSLLAL